MKNSNIKSDDKIKNAQGVASLPLIQRLYLEYRPLLTELLSRYPTVRTSIADGTLAENLQGIFEKIGFNCLAQNKQETRLLVQNLVQWLSKNNLVVLHYHPQYAKSNIVDLLRQVSKIAPNLPLNALIPVFLKTVSPKQQLEVFRLLANFGVKYALFLTPNTTAEQNVEELLEGLLDYSDMLKQKVSVEEERVLHETEEDTQKIHQYSTLNSQADEEMAKGNYEKAIELLTKAVEISPNFNALIQRGDVFFKVRKYVSALRDYRNANNLQKSMPVPHAKIGACCLAMLPITVKNGDSKKAKELYQMGMKHLSTSEKMIEKSISENRNQPEKLSKSPFAPIISALASTDIRGLGMEKEEENIVELTKKMMDATRSVDYMDEEIDVNARVDKATLLARSKYYGEAEKIFRSIIDLDATQVGPAFNNFAIELRKNGQLGKAFQVFKEILQHNVPDRPIIIENLKNAGLRHADKLRTNCELSKAADVYKETLSFQPENTEWILCELAETYLEMDEVAQASFRLMEAVYTNAELASTKKFQKYEKLVELLKDMSKKLTGVEKLGKEKTS
jgi:tetratricopeptide (TPR) repeat protein